MKVKKINILLTLFITTCLIFILTLAANAAVPAKPTLKNNPINGQILPYYFVRLHWYDSSDETYYSMTMRDITAGDNNDPNMLIYNQYYIPKNSTYFDVPTSLLARGGKYRWCLRAHNSNGATCATPQVFTIELYNYDAHIRPGGFSSASNLEYFVYATTSGYDPLLNAGVQAWNGVSSHVHLTRTANPTDGNYELGIFESPSPSSVYRLGLTVPKVGGMNGTVLPESNLYSGTYDYAEIQTYRSNILYWYTNNRYITYHFLIDNMDTFIKSTASHEVGHALSLSHTDDTDNGGYQIHINTENSSLITPLILSSGDHLGPSLNVVDRDHLRLKWGA